MLEFCNFGQKGLFIKKEYCLVNWKNVVMKPNQTTFNHLTMADHTLAVDGDLTRSQLILID